MPETSTLPTLENNTVTGDAADLEGVVTEEATMLGKALKVWWVDAQTWANAWMEADEVADLKLPECITRGVVVKETDMGIYLSQTVSGAEHRNVIGIPKHCISNSEEIP